MFPKVFPLSIWRCKAAETTLVLPCSCPGGGCYLFGGSSAHVREHRKPQQRTAEKSYCSTTHWGASHWWVRLYSSHDHNTICFRHNDLPWNIRQFIHNKLEKVNLSTNIQYAPPWSTSKWSHTDFFRMRKGQVGAQLWTAWAPCGSQHKDAVQITLEQIDLIKRLVEQYSDYLQLAQTAQGKVSFLFFKWWFFLSLSRNCWCSQKWKNCQCDNCGIWTFNWYKFRGLADFPATWS